MAESTESTDRQFRLAPFIFGVIFIAIGVAALGAGVEAETSWIWVALLAGAGITGLVKAIESLRSRPTADQVGSR